MGKTSIGDSEMFRGGLLNAIKDRFSAILIKKG